MVGTWEILGEISGVGSKAKWTANTTKVLVFGGWKGLK
jgi:hypothetical protein